MEKKNEKEKDNPYEIALHHSLLIFQAYCCAPHFHLASPDTFE
jgi:hypothetical protein